MPVLHLDSSTTKPWCCNGRSMRFRMRPSLKKIFSEGSMCYSKTIGELCADSRPDGPFASLVSRMQHSCFLKENLTSQFVCPQNTFPICLCSAFEMYPAFVDGTLNCDQTTISRSVPDPHALPWQSHACFSSSVAWRLQASCADV